MNSTRKTSTSKTSRSKTSSQKLTFKNDQGQELAGLLSIPQLPHRGVALFAHCFTCTKNIAAASRISRALARKKFVVLRFDFTGLGNSDGDFANTNFSSNVQDLISAADYLRDNWGAPEVLIGHSLGGSAVLAAAAHIPESKAVVTIGAPASPEHVVQQFHCDLPTLQEQGEADVVLGGKTFRIKRQFLEDISAQDLREKARELKRALPIFHAPNDEVVDIGEATSLYHAARHPKSFVSLDSADHMLSKAADANYAADVIAAWIKRYIPAAIQKNLVAKVIGIPS